MMQNVTDGVNGFHLKCSLFGVCCLLFGVCCFFSLLFALRALLFYNVRIVRFDVRRKLFGQVGEDVHFVVIKLNIVEVLQD